MAQASKPTGIKFAKLQATGNDFVLVDARGLKRNWPEIARSMCRRHFGVGADGLILLLKSQKADFAMQFFNPDGSESEACGNGLRCLARYLLRKGMAKGPLIKVETLRGIRMAEVRGDLIRVGMGRPELRPEKIPVRMESPGPILDYPLEVKGWRLQLSFVSMGNPHAVYLQGQPVAEFPLAEVGPAVENHPLFPRRTNFEVARVTEAGRIEMRVWERGVGETLSCGSGACAVAVAAQLKGMSGREVRVRLPGGELLVEWDGRREAFLSGPAEFVFEGKWLSHPQISYPRSNHKEEEMLHQHGKTSHTPSTVR